MILCLCRGISDREVDAAIKAGARTVEQVAARCDGAGVDCTACAPAIEHRIALHVRGAPARPPATGTGR